MIRDTKVGLLCVAAACSVAAGCGSQVVAPGPPTAIRHAPEAPDGTIGSVPATPAALRTEPDATTVPRLAASSLLSLPAEQEAVYHRVVQGDTLSSIARQYGVSVRRLLDGNGLDADAPLQPNQLIFIPKGS